MAIDEKLAPERLEARKRELEALPETTRADRAAVVLDQQPGAAVTHQHHAAPGHVAGQ